jgi:hypothetical protein
MSPSFNFVIIFRHLRETWFVGGNENTGGASWFLQI